MNMVGDKGIKSYDNAKHKQIIDKKQHFSPVKERKNLQQLEKQIKKLKKAIDENQSVLDKSSQSLDKEKKELTQKEQEKKSFSQNIAKLTDDLAASTEIIEINTEELKAIEARRNTAKENLENFINKQIKPLIDEQIQEKNEMNNTKNLLDQLKTNSSLDDKLQNLQTIMDQLRKKNVNVKGYDSHLERLNADISKLNNDKLNIPKMNERIQGLLDERKSILELFGLTNTINAYKEKKLTVENLDNAPEKLVEIRNSISKKIQEFEYSYQRIEQSLDSLQYINKEEDQLKVLKEKWDISDTYGQKRQNIYHI